MDRRFPGLASYLLPLTSSRLPRPDLQLPGQVNLGIHHRISHPKRVSAMARLRSADAAPEMALDREWP
jgi:hypothetical protein